MHFGKITRVITSVALFFLLLQAQIAIAQEPVEGYVVAAKEPRVIGFNTENMTEVVPGQLYMKHMVGPDMSVVVLNIKRGEPTPLNQPQNKPAGEYQGDEATRAAKISAGEMPPFHVHGQEIAIVMKGHGKVVLENGDEFPIKEGEAIIMPPGISHTGIFDAPDNLVVSITTPRRPEYGAHNQTEY